MKTAQSNTEVQNKISVQDSGRRSFLRGTALAIAGSTLIGTSLRATTKKIEPRSNKKAPQANKPSQVHTKITAWKETPFPDGRECETLVEVTDENGNSQNAHFFAKWINRNETYIVVHRLTRTKLSPGFAGIISGTKGTIQGDFRTDRITTTLIDDRGAIQRNPESEVNVRLVNPYPGMPPVAAAEASRRGRHSTGAKFGAKFADVDPITFNVCLSIAILACSESVELPPVFAGCVAAILEVCLAESGGADEED